MPLGKWDLLVWSILREVTVAALRIGLSDVQLAENRWIELLAWFPT